ncbi:MAG TPA: isochorismatase family cysteine hydrolase [Syntrophales bacterium]|nr:isochorismatase family cysteine hydrolase [Syntrophales bacterium]HOM07143.1 isochorismatase family cysteine hydrolase [Syntrophales bacterium]HOO00584.1 isochorismatase family cysteine hydrolase [Syntrophales bacterium]HPQ05496.1 isochorismatase family cysteine hydrolase [Syntrophales bacterium]HRV43256.1 isochorismatase family cysteine hydrolase [Syntrophales bacterium]
MAETLRDSDFYTRPHLDISALVTVDLQNDFALPGGSAFVPGTPEIVPNAARLVEAYRRRRLPVVHIVRLYLPDGSNVDNCRRFLVEGGKAIVRPGSDGAEIVDALKPSPSVRLHGPTLLAGDLQHLGEAEAVIYKPRWGAFYRTRLEEHLRSLGIDTIVVAGCNYPNCPRATVYEASERDFRLVLAADAVSGLYERGREEMAKIGVSLWTTDEIIAALARIPPKEKNQ